MVRDSDIPYWYTNKEWWYYDEEGYIQLKATAPQKAKESWKEFQEENDN